MHPAEQHDFRDETFAGRHVLVVGLGKSGMSSIKLLKKMGARVSVSDSSEKGNIDQEALDRLRQEDVFVETGMHSKELFFSADHVVVSPGVPLTASVLQEVRAKGTPIIGEMGLAARSMKTPMAAVTGTNGKSTVVTLLAGMFQSAGKKVFLGGNLGTPLTEYVLGLQDADIAVVEVSSFQLDTAGAFRPDVALLLNITPDHLDRYAGFDAYAESKMSIFAYQKPDDIAVLNGNDEEILGRLHAMPQNRRFFFSEALGNRLGADFTDTVVRVVLSEEERSRAEYYDLSESRLHEEPNVQNTMAAILAGRLMGCSQEDVQMAIRTFTPLGHRLTVVAEINGVTYLDDSKATNIGAVYSALKGMKQPVVLIAGGRDKGGEYGMLDDLVRQRVKAILLIGEARERMSKAFHKLTKVERCDSLEEAVARAGSIAVEGDAVLLSPACASFDMFAGYGHRGEIFSKAVMDLDGKGH